MLVDGSCAINISMAKFSTPVNGTLVSRSSFLTRNMILPLALSWSFDADESEGCISLDILYIQSVGRKAFGNMTWLGPCIQEADYRMHNIIIGA